LASIRPLKDFLDGDAEDTMDQFLSYHPNLESKAKLHDERVERLTIACRELHSAISDHDMLRAVYDEAVKDPSLPSPGLEVGGVEDVSESLKTISQYVVNGAKRLPDYYPLAPLWVKYGERFLSVLSATDLPPAVTALREAGKAACDSADSLIETLTQVRELLATENGVPIVAEPSRSE
jgi:hypothetical protein